MARRGLVAAIAVSAVWVAGGPAHAQIEGRSSVDQRIERPAGTGFRPLRTAAGESWVVREEGVGSAHPGRHARRRSLLYFGQLTDFQLADEESPARVEWLDRAEDPFTAAWRPMEALNPQTIDAMVRQMNAFADRSPVAQAGDARARMAFVLLTGDNVDNQQLNETRWQVGLIEGGEIRPNSGVEATAVYTGVQDVRDGIAPDGAYYDPNAPSGEWSAFPRHPGLLDRAQQPFVTPGLKVPSYVAFGNHDMTTQGVQWANSALEAAATGPTKAFGTGLGTVVAADPARRFVDKTQYKAAHRTGASPDAHGFALVDPAEEAASRGAAGYYQWSPVPGVRMIALDTVCEASSATRPNPSEGNLDHSQYVWLESRVKEAAAADELVILFSHHGIPSLTCDVADEEAAPCTAPDGHGHDVNPGCDLDPRSSAPLHLADDVKALVLRHPHVIAWVAGHTHNNRIGEYVRADGSGGFWSIRVASEIDWPQQSRLLEVMDNRDGTLSIFGTIVDHAAPVDVPANGTRATGFTPEQLASISRLLAANDPQAGATAAGEPGDRNAELIVDDPRRARGVTCAVARGALAARRLGRLATLGEARSRIRRRLAHRTTVRGVDRFCLQDGGRLRVAYRSGRAVALLTSSRVYRALGVRPGSPSRRLRGRATRLDGHWWVDRRERATIAFRVTGGRVRLVGLADARRTRTRRAALALLRSAYR